MTATCADAVFAWLDLASTCIERAAACAVVGHLEREERYLALRQKLDEQVREATYDMQIAETILARLERERAAANQGSDDYVDSTAPEAPTAPRSFWEGTAA